MADTEQQPGEIEDTGAESQTEIQSAAHNEPGTVISGDQDVETEPKEKNPDQIAALPPRRSKVRTTVPSEGVELAIGKPGELEGAEPVTFGQLFQQRVQEFPDVAALKWKETGEEIWQTATFAEYYKFSVDAAKSLLKACKL